MMAKTSKIEIEYSSITCIIATTTSYGKTVSLGNGQRILQKIKRNEKYVDSYSMTTVRKFQKNGK